MALPGRAAALPLLALLLGLGPGRALEAGDGALPESALESLELAIRDLSESQGARYPGGAGFLARLEALRREPAKAEGRAARFESLKREALLANPLLDFERLLLVRRGNKSPRLGLPMNWEGNASLPRTGYDDEISVLSSLRTDATLSTLYRPPGGRFTGDLDLHWDADRLLFSMPGRNGRWQVHEIRSDGTGLRELPLIEHSEVDNYDACYLPGGGVLFTSTATFTGVPCVGGSAPVANLYRWDPPAGLRRLTFEQDHDWCPTVLNDGRILYQRWEYADLPHFASRILFEMRPDGSGQAAYYGSNSYWPNAMFYARPVPDHPSKFVAVVGGHHDVPRMGELVLFDPAQGRREAEGVVQRIPGRGKTVEPLIRDELVKNSWPKFLHPWPLSSKYFLVSAQPSPSHAWGIYLADVHDNLLLLKEQPGSALLEPVPLRARPRPPVLPDRTDPVRRDATVVISDLYEGEGLKGVPRGTVKALRLFTYHFAYRGVGGQMNRVGFDGPWDIKRVLGTVPVEPDGSAHFRVPANTPISIQPLDADGHALQLMRSWMTAMPGESLSCVGCHDRGGAAPRAGGSRALAREPSEISPWRGASGGFSFRREVQPLLDAQCVSCHDGRPGAPDFRDGPDVVLRAGADAYNRGAVFPPSYLALRSFVRTPTIESDLHLLMPAEYHAGTTRLVQVLRKGHHGVSLDAEAWERLAAWIDLNTPAHGTWSECAGSDRVSAPRKSRRDLDRRLSGVDEDPELIPKPAALRAPPRPPPAKAPAPAPAVEVPGWPFGTEEAVARQQAAGPRTRTLDLGGGAALDLLRIPGGDFAMGDAGGDEDERPVSRVTVGAPFWMGRLEVSNAQFARFDASHDSRLETGDFLQFSERERGYPVNGPDQPVCRVSWTRAMEFCRWLSARTGLRVTLPTEAQWEWACRAGTATPHAWGAAAADFAPFANLADATYRSVDTFSWGLPSGAIPPWRPAEGANDGFRVSAPVGSKRAGVWGLSDLHGNVAEWTRSRHRAYPYRDDDGRNSPEGLEPRVVRGGSWGDRPQQARSGSRRAYPAWQGVHDVGFRVVVEDAP